MRRHRVTGPMRPVPSAFVDELLDHWREHGRETLDRVRAWAPRHYLQLVAALAPAGMSERDALAAMSAKELEERFARSIEDSYAAGLMPGWTPPVGVAGPAPAGGD